MNGAEHYDRYVVPFTIPYTEATVSVLPPDARQVLDHGAGTGSVTRAVLRRSPASTVTALDPSIDMMNRLIGSLSATDRPRVQPVTGTVDDLPETAVFDVVTSQLALAFCPDIDRELAALRKRTQSGGTLLVASLGPPEDLGAFTHFWEAARAVVPELSPAVEYRHFSTADPEELSDRLHAAGWTVTAIRRITSWRTLDADEWWDWVSSALPLRRGDGEYMTVDAETRTQIRAAFDQRFRDLADGAPTVTLPMHGSLVVARND